MRTLLYIFLILQIIWVVLDVYAVNSINGLLLTS